MVRKSGHRSIGRTFTYRSDAVCWVQATELEIEREGLIPDRSILKTSTLADLLARYRDAISPAKRGHLNMERWVLERFLRHPMAQLKLSELRREHLQEWCDGRLEEVSASTVRRQLAILSHLFEIASSIWRIPIENLTRKLVIPVFSDRRQRRLTAAEGAQLLVAVRASRNPHLLPILLLAKETSMRRGELLALRWDQIGKDHIFIRTSKNGESRTIALSNTAIAILDSVAKIEERVFPISPSALSQAWRRLAKRAGVNDLRFHDLRHEAISRFFELGLTAPEVQSMSGHKDMRMLYSYAHANRLVVLSKLNGQKD
ncbi:site-specific integrase [Mesorhizobium sp. M0586]|uniref:site-specific integrase n=1 Tax=unclassified Mesorhizobium TaxID=325217 RepID=UPI00333ABBA4